MRGLAESRELQLAHQRKERAAELMDLDVANKTRADLFLGATLRRMPTANAEGGIESEGGVGKVWMRRVFRFLRIGHPRITY